MREIPSRENLALLNRAINDIVPIVSFGFAQNVEDDLVSILYSARYGFGQLLLAADESPAVFRATPGGARQSAGIIDSNSVEAVKALIPPEEALRVASFHVSRYEPVTRLWIGLGDSSPLTTNQLDRLQAIADNAITAPSVSADEV